MTGQQRTALLKGHIQPFMSPMDEMIGTGSGMMMRSDAYDCGAWGGRGYVFPAKLAAL